MNFAFATFCFLLPSLAFSGVKVFKGESGERLYIESTAKPENFLVKMTGFTSVWNDKVMETRLSKSSSRDTYVIDYEKKTGISKGPREYNMVLVSGATLSNGSIVKVAEVFFPEIHDKGAELKYDEKLTDDSQSIGLGDQFKKAPFKHDFFKK